MGFNAAPLYYDVGSGQQAKELLRDIGEDVWMTGRKISNKIHQWISGKDGAEGDLSLSKWISMSKRGYEKDELMQHWKILSEVCDISASVCIHRPITRCYPSKHGRKMASLCFFKLWTALCYTFSDPQTVKELLSMIKFLSYIDQHTVHIVVIDVCACTTCVTNHIE